MSAKVCPETCDESSVETVLGPVRPLCDSEQALSFSEQQEIWTRALPILIFQGPKVQSVSWEKHSQLSETEGLFRLRDVL